MPAGVAQREYTVRLRDTTRHKSQHAFIESEAKRKMVRAGRRGGKTTGVSQLALKAFLNGRRVLYATPTADQISKFWTEVCRALAEPIEAGILYKNETLHTIQVPGTETRIRAKTAWNADTLRGDYADLLILDEFQLMNEDTWEVVGAPMLLDTDGDAVFIYTPPSLRTRSVSKADDPRHAAKMFARARMDSTGRWETFHFTSYDNPFISQDALGMITEDMTNTNVRQEILAEDLDEAPGALWTRALLDKTRVEKAPESMSRIAIGVDPPGGATECGIVAEGMTTKKSRYVLADESLRGGPDKWSNVVIDLYLRLNADIIVVETNFGGDMVRKIVTAAAQERHVQVRIREVRATRGKAIRAEPVVAAYERGEVHHVGPFSAMEDELTLWVPGETLASPNRMDALVWADTALSGRGAGARGF